MALLDFSLEFGICLLLHLVELLLAGFLLQTQALDQVKTRILLLAVLGHHLVHRLHQTERHFPHVRAAHRRELLAAADGLLCAEQLPLLFKRCLLLQDLARSFRFRFDACDCPTYLA